NVIYLRDHAYRELHWPFFDALKENIVTLGETTMLFRKLILAAVMAAAIPAMALAATTEVTIKNNSTSGTANVGSISCIGCTPNFPSSISNGASVVFTAQGNTIDGFMTFRFDMTRGVVPARTCRASLSVNYDPATGQALSLAGTPAWVAISGGTRAPTCTQTSAPTISRGKVLWNLSFVAN
ncbi:hypothetical protein ACCT25_26795, partial [Rhizobium ruizarguesonis]